MRFIRLMHTRLFEGYREWPSSYDLYSKSIRNSSRLSPSVFSLGERREEFRMIRRDDDDVRFVQDTYTFCFRANPSLLLLFNGAYRKSSKYQYYTLWFYSNPRSTTVNASTIYHSRCEHDLPQSMRSH